MILYPPPRFPIYSMFKNIFSNISGGQNDSLLCRNLCNLLLPPPSVSALVLLLSGLGELVQHILELLPDCWVLSQLHELVHQSNHTLLCQRNLSQGMRQISSKKLFLLPHIPIHHIHR